MLMRARLICQEPLEERAERMGVIALGDIRRAQDATYEHWSPVDRVDARARDLRSAVALAQHAWCAALDALGYRETPCRCLVGGGHRT